MIIAKQKREENIAEFLLYMWQIEDIVRANNLDIEQIQKIVIDKFDQDQNVKLEIRKWYQDLIDMMRLEGVAEKGHLQINKNVISNLGELHSELLKSPKHSDYQASYYRTLPFIVELRAKGADRSQSEVETCFSALYGFLLLKIQQKEVSGETQAGISQISSLLRQLSDRYQQERSGSLEL